MNIILIGYRCTGKTSVGRRITERFQLPFYDTDELITSRTGRAIGEIVGERGWGFFREEEKAVIRGLAGAADTVIAVGGGAVMEAENREVLKRSGLFIWLTADMRTIVQRMKSDKAGAEQRPPLFGGSSAREASETLKERMPIYRELADLTVDTSGKGIEAVVEEVCDLLVQRISGFGRRGL